MSDANRKTMPMKYKVCAEVLVPGINTADLSAIFEEHRVCKELGVLGQHQFHEVTYIHVHVDLYNEVHVLAVVYRRDAWEYLVRLKSGSYSRVL